MNRERTFVVNVNNRIYILKKNIYDYSTFSPDTNVITDVAYNTIKQPTKSLSFVSDIFTSSIIVNELYQYLYNNDYYYLKITNLIENDNKQYVVVELLNPEFFINGKRIELIYYHLINQENFIQKHAITKYEIDVSDINSYKIVRVILNAPIINCVEVIYTDVNNNTTRYIITPEIIRTNNIHYINRYIGNFNGIFLERDINTLSKENLENTYTHTLILSDLELINRTVLDNVVNQIKESEIKSFSSSQIVFGRTIMDELFFITTSLNESTNNTVRENYLVSNIHGISYTSTTIVSELVPA